MEHAKRRLSILAATVLALALILAVGTMPAWAEGEESSVQLKDTAGTVVGSYSSIDAAYAQASDGYTLALIGDSTVGSTITVDKGITIDMAGHDITVNAAGYAFDVKMSEAGKTFMIIGADGSEIIAGDGSSSNGVARIASGCAKTTVDISAVSIHGYGGATAPYMSGNGVIADDTGTDGKDSNDGREDVIKLNGVNIYTAGDIITGTNGRAYANLNISGGTFVGNRGFRFCGDSSTKSTISGVNLTVKGGIAVYAFSNADLSGSTIDMATTKNNDAVAGSRAYNSTATLTISDTTVNAHGAAASAVAVEGLGNVVIASGTFTNDNEGKYVVKVSNSSGTITVNGGTVDASKCNFALYSNTKYKSEDPDASIIVNAGTVIGGKGIETDGNAYGGIACVSSDHAFIKLNGGTYSGLTTVRKQNTQYVNIIGNIVLNVSGGGKIAYGDSQQLFDGESAAITADMAGAKATYYKLIDYTGSETKTLDDYAKVTLANAGEGEDAYTLAVVDNDLYAKKPVDTKTLYVDAGWAGQTTGTVVAPGIVIGMNGFATIQGAVANADVSDGAVTVEVASGTYNEDINLKQDNLSYTESEKTWYGKIHLTGMPGATVTGSGFTFGNGPDINVADVIIDGFTFEGNAYPIYIDNNSAETGNGNSKNICISNNTFNYQGYGPYVVSARIDGLTVTGNAFNSTVKNNATIGGATGCTIGNSTISGNTFANYFGLYGKVVEEGVTVSGNTFSGSGDEGLWINNSNEKSTGTITVSGNTIAATYTYALGFKTTYDGKADIVIGEGNTYGGAAIAGWAEVADDTFLVSSDASAGEAQYYDARLYLGDETAFKSVKSAYDAASDSGTLVMANNETPVAVAKAAIDMATLYVDAEWAGKAEGAVVTVGEGDAAKTCYVGLNAFGSFKGAVAGKTAATQNVVFAEGTYTGDDNYGKQVFVNAGEGTLTLGTTDAVVSSDPENCTGTVLTLGTATDTARFFDEATADKYALAAGSKLTVFQFNTEKYGNVLFSINGDMTTQGAYYTKAGTRTDIAQGASLTLDGSIRPSANGTGFYSYGTTNVYGTLALNVNEINSDKRIKIGYSSYQNKDAQLNVNGGTVTVRGVASASTKETFDDSNPAVTKIYACADVLEGDTAASLNVTNGGLYDTAGAIENDGVITIDAKANADGRQSLVKAAAYSGTGTIVADMTDATADSYKLVDYTGAGTMTLADYGTVTLLNNDGYVLKVAENDLCAIRPVAQVGDEYFETIAEAVAAADGKTIAMIADAAENVAVPAGKSITLDLNGHAVAGDVSSAGSLTVTDSTAGASGCLVGSLATTGAGAITVTGGCYSSSPAAYLGAGFYVYESGIELVPYRVAAGEPQEKQVIVAEDTEAKADLPADTPQEAKEAVDEALKTTWVSGVAEALAADPVKQAEFLADAGVTEEMAQDASTALSVEIEVRVKVTAVQITTAASGTSSVVFEAKPYADIVNGTQTVKSGVPVSNEYLSGQLFTVYLGVPEGIEALQILHSSADGDEVFNRGEAASYALRTFAYDEQTRTAAVQVNRFSTFTIQSTKSALNVTLMPGLHGTGAADVRAATAGDPYVLPACPFEANPGYAFAGWNTAEDGTGTAYAAGAEVTLTDDAVFYAQWTVSARIAGDDRYGTAAKAALEAFPNGANAVVVASGENFPDALCASALAGLLECPVVLTPQASLSADAASAIEALAAGGSVDVYVAGGTAAVSADVVAALKAVSGVAGAVRIAGEDRYGTAEAIYEFGTSVAGGWGSQAVLATGTNYPDALSMSAFAYALDAPILLTDGTGNMTKGTADILANGRIDNVVIAGGTAAVSSDVDAEAKRLTGGTAVRLAGEDRYGTSKAVAEYLKGLDGFSLDGACVATGKNFADALAAGPLAGANRTAVLLADDGFTGALDALKGAGASHIYVMGGTAAVPASVEVAALEAAGLR